MSPWLARCAHEPGVLGDLLVLMSQDRWIRIKGLTDDLKAVTAGQWLQDENFFESAIEGCATVVVYLAAEQFTPEITLYEGLCTVAS